MKLLMSLPTTFMTAGGYLFAVIAAFEDPRAIIIISVAGAAAGGVRYALKYVEQRDRSRIRFDWITFFLNIGISMFVGWMTALTLAHFRIVEDDAWKFALASGFSGVFSTEITRSVPLVLNRLGGKSLGIELSKEEMDYVLRRREEKRRTRAKRAASDDT